MRCLWLKHDVIQTVLDNLGLILFVIMLDKPFIEQFFKYAESLKFFKILFWAFRMLMSTVSITSLNVSSLLFEYRA